MPYDTLERASIEEMIRVFYASILKDEMLSPFFTKALGDDLNNGKWHEHFHTLNSFWVMMMTGERGYNGDPFPPHAFLGPLKRENFERWLELFHETIYTFYTPEIAEKFYKKADILAEQFMDNLGVDDDEDDD